MANDRQPAAGGETIRLREKLGYAASPATLEMISNFGSLYLLVFYTNVCGISPAAAGTLMLLCVLWNAVNDPIIGFWADNRRFKNGEKLRPYFKWCALPVGLFLALLFWMPELGPVQAFFYALVFYYLYDTFATALQMPSISLSMLMTNDPAQRISINTFYALGATLGPIFCSVTAVTLMRLFGGGTDAAGNILDPRAGYRGAILVYVVIMIVGQFVAYAVTKERVKPLDETKDRIPAGTLLRVLFGERNWVLNVLFALCYVLCMQMVMIPVVYFVTYVLGRPGFEQVVAPVLLLASLLVMPFIKGVNKRFSRRGILVMAALCFLVSKIPFVLFPRSLPALFINAVGVGMGVAFGLVGINSNQAEVVDIIEWKNGFRIEGSINAVRGFIFKGIGALVPFALGLVMESAGFVQPTDTVLQPVQNAATQSVFIAFLGWLPLIVSSLMLLLAFIIPTDRDAADMRTQKAASAAS